MPSQLAPIDETIALINAIAGTPFRLVAGIGAFAALKPNVPPPALPACYVLPLNDVGGKNRLENGVDQKVECLIGIIIVTAALQDPKGGQATSDLQSLRLKIVDALLGVEPTADADPFLFADGEPIPSTPGYVWHQDSYSTSYTLRRT